jgi:hypothetical protein
MKRRRSWFQVAAAVLVVATSRAAETNSVLVATTSSSREFVVYAANVRVSSVLCAFAEQIKRQWLQRLELTDGWRDPIVIVVQNRQPGLSDAPVLTGDMIRTEVHTRYRLTLVVPPAPDDDTLVAAIVELLCAELANRGQPRQPGAEQLAAPVPVWLSEGLAQSILGQTDRLLAIARRSASGVRPQTAMELMRITRLPADTADRGLYRANAWLLSEALLRLPSGPQKMQQFLSELGAAKVFASAFQKVYGEDFPDTAALENWWAAQLKLACESMVAANLSATETALRLDTILTVEVQSRPAFDQLWRYYDQAWLRPILLEKLTGLQALNIYGHPLYRPVVAKYSEAIQQLLGQNITRFRRGVREADQRRKIVDEQVRQIRDAVNRAERTYVKVETNEFAGFFRTLDQLQRFEQQRRDPISDYLDQFDK